MFVVALLVGLVVGGEQVQRDGDARAEDGSAVKQA